eukprot:gb/GFBE01006326.1/.p1 GENE.gb/GFBE01006326.1/~~gb/GFBE01006326.1/.p1  ORF type:complete len:242 (+),score=62.48 gb/GFBE01006326.1/:1-726(+)
MLFSQTWEKFETVYDAKHRSALYLHDSLERIENPNLKFFWLFSSTAVYGNPGQINYSGSNSCLDSLARHRHARGLPGTSMHWGAWGEVGMASSLDDAIKANIEKGPYPMFSNQQGLAGCEGGLRTGLPEFQTFLMNPTVLMKVFTDSQTPGCRHDCNFYSGVLPFPKPTTFDRDHMYEIYRTYRYFLDARRQAEKEDQEGEQAETHDDEWERIWWNKFMTPAAQPKKEDDDILETVHVEFI